jgi:hypothetical protein
MLGMTFLAFYPSFIKRCFVFCESERDVMLVFLGILVLLCLLIPVCFVTFIHA